MAEKKSWRDYKNTDTQTPKPSATKSWRDSIPQYRTQDVGADLYDRVDTWLKNHDNYIKNFQNRTSWRKYDYTDPYMEDSQDWLDTVSQQKNNFDTEAGNILKYMDMYKDQLDRGWVENVRKILGEASNAQKIVVENATQDNTWWKSFGGEEGYRTNQRLDGYQKKYGGQSYSQLQKALSALEDGEERKWLEFYAPTTITQNDVRSEIAANDRELMQLNTLMSKAMDLRTKAGIVSYDDADLVEKEISSLLDHYGGMEGLQAKIEGLNKSNWELNNQLQYGFLSQNEDYADYAKVAKTKPTAGFGIGFGTEWFGKGDPVYDYINELGKTHEQWKEDWEDGDQGGRTYEKYSYMDENEVKNYNYLYNTQGKEAAQVYLDYLDASLNERKLGIAKENAVQLAKEKPILANILSVPANLASGLGALDIAGQVIGKNIKEAVTGEYAGPVDYNRPAMTPGATSSTIRETTSKTIADKTGTIQLNPEKNPLWSKVLNGKSLADVYQLGMSMADSAAVALMAPVLGTAGTYLLGGSAATQGILDAVANGATDEQALTMGLINGGFEMLFEKYELESLLGESKSIVGGIVKQALSEGVGEASTTIANTITDALVMADKSQYRKSYGEYIAKGLSPEDARKQALLDIAVQVGWDFVGGMASGGVMGGTVAPFQVNAAKNQAALEQYGGQTKDLIQTGLEMPANSQANKLAQKYQQKEADGKTLTGAQIRNLLAKNQKAITAKDMKLIQQAAAKRLTELGQTENVEQIAELATKFATGQKLTKEERSTLAHSQYGSKVSKELLPENIEANYAAKEWAKENSGEEIDIDDSYSWAENIGTRKVNFEAYNKEKIKKAQEAFAEMVRKATEGPNAYKPLESRVEAESKVQVSDTGKSVIHGTDQEVDLSNPHFKEIAEDRVVLYADGKAVDANNIDYADADLGYAIKAVGKIEHMTPEYAGAMVGLVDKAKPVVAQMNGLDEAFTYGFYNYSEADLKAGNFTGNLTPVQLNDAYKLGQQVRSKTDMDADAPVVKMRTAAEAKLSEEQKMAKQKAEIESKDVDVYFEDGGTVVKFDEHTGKYDPKRTAAVNTAKFLAKLKIGGKYYFFESYLNEAGERVYKDANGNEKSAPNGIYVENDGSIHIDLNAGDDGNGIALFTLGHELTHFVKAQSKKQFKILADLVTEAFDKTNLSMHKRVLAKQKFLEDARRKKAMKGESYKKVSYDEAYEEVVADAMSTMLTDGTFHEKLMEIKVKDKGLFNTIKRFFEDMFAKFRKEYEQLTPDQQDAQDIRAMKDMFDKIQTAFAEALVEASENFQAAMESVVEADAKPMPSDQIVTEGAVVTDGNGDRHSIRSMKHDIAEGKMFEDLKKVCGWTDAQVNTLRKQLNDLVEYMIPYRNILDMNETYGMEGRRFSPYKPNSDPLYKISMDFSTLCSKRLLTQYVIENLQLRENRPMSAEEQMAIRAMLNEYRKVEKGLQVACAMCYVEAARLKSPKQIQRWLDDPTPHLVNYFAQKNTEFNNSVKEAQADFKESKGYDRNAPKKDMKPADVKELNKIGPKLRSQYQLSAEEQAIVEKAKTLPNSTYLTAGNLANLSETDPVIYAAYTSFVRTATRSKSLETDEPYYYGDSTRDNGNGIVVTDSFIESVNRENGMRFSSWSDWRIQHLLDYITAVIDNSVRGAAMHGYTKFGDEVRVLGKTGMMFNMSGVTGTQTGLNEDGSLNFSDTESIDVNEAIQLREEFPETAGLQCIGVSNEHIIALLRSEIIDYVIPYHVSGLNAALRRMADIHGWADYTGTQNASIDKSIKLEDAVDKEHWHEEPVFSEFFVGYDTGMTGIEAMRESGKRYVQMCKDRGLTPKFNQFANEENYWKLLIDRKMINQQTGNLIQQKAVTPTFDFDVIKGVVDKFVDNYDAGLEARALNHIVENWDSIPQRIKDLKKQGGTKTKKAAKAADTLANQTVAAQPKDGEKHSERYGGIREALAKKGLDELSKKFGNRFPLSASFDATMKADNTPLVMETVQANQVKRKPKESAFKAGKQAFAKSYGTKTTVHIKQMGIDAELFQSVAGESISKALGRPDEQSTLDVIPHISDILSNSIFMGIERIAHTDSKGTALYGYRLYNLYWYQNGNKKTPNCLVCTVVQDLDKAEGYVFQNIENVTVGHGLPGNNTGMPKPSSGNTYNVSQLYQTVKKIDRSNGGLKYTDAERDKYLFTYTERNDGEKYSERGDGASNRHLLANAFEGISQNSEEYKMIQEYRKEIGLLNKLDKELQDINQQIRDISFSKGPRDNQKLQKLEEKAERIARDISKQDKQLLNMEASEPLRKVIERERKKENQKVREHINEIQQNKKMRAEQTELRHKIRKTVRDLNKILNRGNKKQNVKEDMKGFASKALELADFLFTDHISNDDLIRNGITVRMTPKEAALVKETEEILSKLYDQADSLTDEEFKRLDEKRKANEYKLRDLLTAQRNERLNTPVYNLFNDLVTEYAKLKNSGQEAVKAAYNADVERFLRSYIGEANGETDSDRKTLLQNMRVADMTTDELWKLSNAYEMVLHSIRQANTLFVKGKAETLEQKVGRIAKDFESRKIPEGKVATIARNLSNKIGWDYEKLYYALDRIGSEAFTELVMNIADAENIVMQDVMEAAAFRDEMVKKYDYNNWSVNKEIDREFLDSTGKKFKLTLGQLMALYAYSRRDGAWDHIEYGGFVFGEAALTNPRPADSYKLSKEQCMAITDLLTKEQKGYAEDMQKFLSENMGEKGNEVSMLLYGIKMFGEKNYFPIHIAGQFKAQANESQAKAAAGFSSMTNAGFTHAQNPNAKAPFVLEGFNEIWVDHVNEMSRYHGTVPALEDMRRVMNYSHYSEASAESIAIKQLMENSFGKEAVDYFDNLYREANSGAITDKLQKKSKQLLSMFRKNSVAYSLSVLVQQPASVVRAYAMIDRKYFGVKGVGVITSGVAKAIGNKWTKAHTNAYNEMLKYAPGVTMAKEIGGFDTATGGSIRSYLLDTNKSLKKTVKTGNAKEVIGGLANVVDDNAIANLPNVADKIAWIEIWTACKRETAAKHKDLATNSDEFMKIVGERFTEVIRATQVYDSIFSKSPMLKSKNLAVQYLVSFMNEPNTVANMVEKAVRDAAKGNWKSGARTAAVVIHSIVFTNVLKSLVYAMRDDDEDETYIEKYLEAVAGNMMSDFNPLNYIPIARDVWSIAQGYDVERADMAVVADALDSLDRVIKNATKDTEGMTEEQLIAFDKKVTDANWKLVESVAAFFGIPVKNIRREFKGVLNTARNTAANHGMTTKQSVWDKVYDSWVDSIPFMSTNAKNKQDKLYEAILSGDKVYVERLKATYKTAGKTDKEADDAYHAAVRKALRENDPRIHEAAQARYDGNIAKTKQLYQEIKKEGKFDPNDILEAINSEEAAIKKGTEPKSESNEYSATDFVDAVLLGDANTAKTMRDSIIRFKVKDGKTQEEAEESFAESVRDATKNAFNDDLLDAVGAKNMLLEYADMDEEEASAKVEYWDFVKENPKYKDDLNQARYEKYKDFAEPAEIPLDIFVQYMKGTSGIKTIYDEWGDEELSARDQVLAVIDSLDLTWQQKDALYLAHGYAESQIWDVPW